MAKSKKNKKELQPSSAALLGDDTPAVERITPKTKNAEKAVTATVAKPVTDKAKAKGKARALVAKAAASTDGGKLVTASGVVALKNSTTALVLAAFRKPTKRPIALAKVIAAYDASDCVKSVTYLKNKKSYINGYITFLVVSGKIVPA